MDVLIRMKATSQAGIGVTSFESETDRAKDKTLLTAGLKPMPYSQAGVSKFQELGSGEAAGGWEEVDTCGCTPSAVAAGPTHPSCGIQPLHCANVY